MSSPRQTLPRPGRSTVSWSMRSSRGDLKNCTLGVSAPVNPKKLGVCTSRRAAEAMLAVTSVGLSRGKKSKVGWFRRCPNKEHVIGKHEQSVARTCSYRRPSLDHRFCKVVSIEKVHRCCAPPVVRNRMGRQQRCLAWKTAEKAVDRWRHTGMERPATVKVEYFSGSDSSLRAGCNGSSPSHCRSHPVW